MGCNGFPGVGYHVGPDVNSHVEWPEVVRGFSSPLPRAQTWDSVPRYLGLLVGRFEGWEAEPRGTWAPTWVVMGR